MISGHLGWLSFQGLYVLGAAVFWGLICWALLVKAGYRSTPLWIMLVLMLFTPFGIILFALLPFPLQRQLDDLYRRSGKNLPQTEPTPSENWQKDIETELNRMKGAMGLTRMKRPKQ
ncbi:MAG TPA: hypothetical protein V6D07_17090 [Trichocoleus sp.]